MVSQPEDTPFLWMWLSTAFSQETLFIPRPGRMNSWWERKCLAPMLLMQLMGCSGKLKATSIFLSWLLEHLPDFFIFGTALVLCEKVSRYIRLLGRCIPPSSGVLEWHRGNIEPALAHLHFSIAPSKLYYQI